MPAPKNRVFCPCFRATEISNNKQWDNSRPEPGSNERSSGEREACLWLLYGSHSKENEGFYSLDNLRHLKLDNVAACPRFIPLVNCEKTGWITFHHCLINFNALCHWHYFASPLTSCSTITRLPSHRAPSAWPSGHQLLYGSVMPGLPQGRGLPLQSRACVKWRSSQHFHSWNLRRETGTYLRPRGRLLSFGGVIKRRGMDLKPPLPIVV